jgi:hypothetical protein
VKEVGKTCYTYGAVAWKQGEFKSVRRPAESVPVSDTAQAVYFVSVTARIGTVSARAIFIYNQRDCTGSPSTGISLVSELHANDPHKRVLFQRPNFVGYSACTSMPSYCSSGLFKRA